MNSNQFEDSRGPMIFRFGVVQSSLNIIHRLFWQPKEERRKYPDTSSGDLTCGGLEIFLDILAIAVAMQKDLVFKSEDLILELIRNRHQDLLLTVEFAFTHA